MDEDKIMIAKLILEDYQGFRGDNMKDINTTGILSYRKYLKDIKGLNEKAIENTIILLSEYLKVKKD